jgi:DNA-binding transcriptional LysR family regulator
MDRIDDMRLLVRIIETGSLSAAAREVKTTQPTVSKRLRALEAALGVRLLNRNTRHLEPTEAGFTYFHHCKRWLTELDELNLKLKPGVDGIAGRIRLNSAVTFGACVLTRLAARFRRQHPDVMFDLELTDRRVDLVQDRVDIAFRIGGVGNPDLMATRLGGYTFAVAASKQWAKQHPEVRTLAALAQQPVLTYDNAPTSTVEGPGGPVVVRKDMRLELDSSIGLRQLALEHEGPVLVARFVIDEDLQRGDLVELIPGANAAPLPIYAVTLPVRPVPLRIKAFLQFMKRDLATVPGWVP